jgi:hypothetical protein
MNGISGTEFNFEEPHMLVHLAQAESVQRVMSYAEFRELLAECEEGANVDCISCDDGAVFFELRFDGEDLELFLRLGVAFRHGAWERQGPALLKIAADMGASTLAFETRRRGWYRRLGPEWRRRGSQEMVREVPNVW